MAINSTYVHHGNTLVSFFRNKYLDYYLMRSHFDKHNYVVPVEMAWLMSYNRKIIRLISVCFRTEANRISKKKRLVKR